MRKLLTCPLTMTLLLGGCDTHRQLPREIVFVPDISASIDPGAERQMFAAIEDVAQHLHRGDTLTIIPITGNAEAELQGRTLRYAVPRIEGREAYDADLHRLNAQIKGDLARLQTDSIMHPGKYTDILGSIRVAMKEFSSGATDKRLIVLSDFIQDDKQFNFRRDPQLGTGAGAAKLAHHVSQEIVSPSNVSILLGRLKSTEFSELAPNRQRAIDTFWHRVMPHARVNPDGTAAVFRNPLAKD